MHFSIRSKVSILLTLVGLVAIVGGLWVTEAQLGAPAHAAQAMSPLVHIDCSNSVQAPLCTDVANSEHSGSVWLCAIRSRNERLHIIPVIGFSNSI